MTEDTPKEPQHYYEGCCPDHGGRSQWCSAPVQDFQAVCTKSGCDKEIIWVLQHEKHWPPKPETGLHYLILRYNGDLVEVFKGEEQQMVILFDQFRDACFREPLPKKIRIGRRLILDISELHSVQMADNKEDADALTLPPFADGSPPYYYPELKNQNQRKQRNEFSV